MDVPGRGRGGVVATVIALALLMAACSSSRFAGSTAETGADHGVSRTDAAGTVWLCRPGLAADPCTSNLDVTTVPATGPRTVRHPASEAHSPFDCFYAYPTVSTQPTDNADLEVQAGEIGAAISQAAPFSQACRVWAPMYRQRTEASLSKGLGNDPKADAVAYASFLRAWNDYLDHYNDGRPIVFIGHSQGAAMLIRLLASQVDPNPTLRSRMISAIIAGGNVAIPTGREVGSTFQHIPLCTAPGQLSCVIAYSTFPGPPPKDSEFGRPGQGVSLQAGQTATEGVQVACVNPAALGDGSGVLDPWFPTSTSTPGPPPVTTPWVSYPGLYTAACQSSDGATWLDVNDVAGHGDRRPVVTERLGPAWGFHLDDINLASGNLVEDVRGQERAFASAHPGSR